MSLKCDSLCPNIYNTEGLFNDWYNEDSSKKCGPLYDYKQTAKLNCGTDSEMLNDDKFNYSNVEQLKTGQNGPVSFNNTTGGNMMSQRAVGAAIRPMEVGNKESNNVLNGYPNCNNKETFNTPEFTTTPTPLTTGSTSALYPEERAPFDDFNGAKCLNNCNNFGSKLRNEIVKPIDAVKEGVLFSLTFGQNKNKESFCMCNRRKPTETACGKVIGCVIIVSIIFIIGILIFTAVIYSKTGDNNGKLSGGASGFFNTMGELIKSPSKVINNAFKNQNNTNAEGITNTFEVL